jgi:hypothetical protein
MTMNTRPIPATQEALPVVGCGTWIGFDQRPGTEEYQRLPGVLDALFAAGGKVIDSSPMYGRSEETTGELLAAPASLPASAQRDKAFLATKVWTSGREAGIAQMEQSFKRLRTRRIDLMQVHNLVDWRTHLATLRGWKDKGRVRYIGITHYTASAYAEVEAVLRAEKLDFLQINYSADARDAVSACCRWRPSAAWRWSSTCPSAVAACCAGCATSRCRLGRGHRLHQLGAGAAEVRAEPPGVTCVIPGTSRAQHMADNATAGTGAYGNAAFWRAHIEELGG